MAKRSLGVTDTEVVFNRFMISLGGERVDALFSGIESENADYFLRKERVVAELKVIENNRGLSKEFLRKRLADNSMATAISDSPLNEWRHELVQSYRSSMEPICRKANRQLSQTKSMLEPEGYGVLFVVNNAFTGLRASTTAELLFQIISDSCRSIDAVIYISYKLSLALFGHGSKVWLPLVKSPSKLQLGAWADRIGLQWRDFIAEDGYFRETLSFETMAEYDDWEHNEATGKHSRSFVRVMAGA